MLVYLTAFDIAILNDYNFPPTYHFPRSCLDDISGSYFLSPVHGIFVQADLEPRNLVSGLPRCP